jgi:hypothetical protein
MSTGEKLNKFILLGSRDIKEKELA